MNNYAKRKALEFIIGILAQADPETNTRVGSVVRALLVLPFALTYAAVFADIEILRNLFLGNFNNLSEGQMDLLAQDLLVERPQGSRSVGVVRVYMSAVQTFTLEQFPYFSTSSGQEYQPVSRVTFTPGDFIEDGGLVYVTVPIISVLFGEQTAAEANEINQFSNLPITARSVTNVSATQGGDARANNEEFFNFIQKTFNDGTLNESAGVTQYIVENFPDARATRVVDAGDPLMLRDEVWTEDFVYPNLDRVGQPFSPVLVLGTIDFDNYYGRAYSATGLFTEDMLGQRISISGDIEKFRKIIRYINPNYVVLSGPPQTGSASAELWSEAPHILNMADVYLYYPTLQIQSRVVDKRFNLVAIQDQQGSFGRIFFAVAQGFSYAEYPQNGKIAIAEGTDREQIYTVFNSGFDGVNLFVDIPTTTIDVLAGDVMSFYDMSSIIVGEDIIDTPIIYVLQIDRLDPLSFDLIEQIPETKPGNFNDPGWYISNTDPAEVFSVREKKAIILDSKEDLPSTVAVFETGSRILDSASYNQGVTNTVTTGQNSLSKFGFDFSGMEGREITITRSAIQLDDENSTIVNAAVSGAGTQTLTVTNMNVRYVGDVGGRDDVVVAVYDNTPSLINFYSPGEVLVYGDKIDLKSGIFSASADSVDVFLPQITSVTPTPNAAVPGGDIAWISGVFNRWNGSEWVPYVNPFDATPFIPETSTESVILTVPSTDTIVVTNTLPIILDVLGVKEVFNTTISAESQGGNFDAGPVRVIYATHNDFRAIQNVFDDNQLLVKDTLARSFFPSVIDATIRYSGDSTSQEVFDRFVELLNTAVTETDNGQRLRLDVSNIVAALDDEGLTDSIDVNFEIKLTTFLDDGESIVQYLNPSEATSQNMAVDVAINPGDTSISVRRLNTTGVLSGRGIVRLGGNNPSTQESIPYEAVVDNGDGTFNIILRSQKQVAFSHPQWETVNLSVRDYDPDLEFTEGAIFVSPNNRPYVRRLIVIKEGS